MGLAELIKQGPPRKKNKCVVGNLIDSLNEEDAKALVNALDQLQNGSAPFSAAWLQRVLVSEGHKVGPNSVTRHINEGCSCATK